jgi:hypothetical protein
MVEPITSGAARGRGYPAEKPELREVARRTPASSEPAAMTRPWRIGGTQRRSVNIARHREGLTGEAGT